MNRFFFTSLLVCAVSACYSEEAASPAERERDQRLVVESANLKADVVDIAGLALGNNPIDECRKESYYPGRAAWAYATYEPIEHPCWYDGKNVSSTQDARSSVELFGTGEVWVKVRLPKKTTPRGIGEAADLLLINGIPQVLILTGGDVGPRHASSLGPPDDPGLYGETEYLKIFDLLVTKFGKPTTARRSLPVDDEDDGTAFTRLLWLDEGIYAEWGLPRIKIEFLGGPKFFPHPRRSEARIRVSTTRGWERIAEERGLRRNAESF